MHGAHGLTRQWAPRPPAPTLSLPAPGALVFAVPPNLTAPGGGTSTPRSRGRACRPRTGVDPLHSPHTGPVQTRGSPLPCRRPLTRGPRPLGATGGGFFFWDGGIGGGVSPPQSPRPPPSFTTSSPPSSTLTPPPPLHWPGCPPGSLSLSLSLSQLLSLFFSFFLFILSRGQSEESSLESPPP